MVVFRGAKRWEATNSNSADRAVGWKILTECFSVQVNPHTHQVKLCDFGSAKVLVRYICLHFSPFLLKLFLFIQPFCFPWVNVQTLSGLQLTK